MRYRTVMGLVTVQVYDTWADNKLVGSVFSDDGKLLPWRFTVTKGDMVKRGHAITIESAATAIMDILFKHDQLPPPPLALYFPGTKDPVAKRVTLEVIESLARLAIFDNDMAGLCLACGNETTIEPDAERLHCEVCDELQVYGAEQLLLMYAS